MAKLGDPRRMRDGWMDGPRPRARPVLTRFSWWPRSAAAWAGVRAEQAEEGDTERQFLMPTRV